MRKYFITLFVLSAIIFNVMGQKTEESAFTTVPVLNGKVIFQQFIHTNQSLSEDQKYAILYKWGKDNYSGNPLLSGIRFDDKARSITVSSKVELLLPPDGSGKREKMTMNYRFDASVTAAGIMLTVRDITYLSEGSQGGTVVFPKAYSAEEMITDQAINSDASLREFRMNTQKGTLAYLNKLYAGLANAFKLS